MKKILGAIALTLLPLAALADNVLVYHSGYDNVHTNVTNRLEAAGHTVTLTTSAVDFSGYEQVWDMRFQNALSTTEIDDYDAFVKDGGYLYLATENPGCCQARNDSVAALVTQTGGGTTTIGGTAGWASNDGNNPNTTYITDGVTVTFAAVAGIANDQGTPLLSGSDNVVAGMMWVGNAGDLGTDYTGTILTVADINWLGGSFYTPNNQIALDDIINGVVAGTVAGTISDSGTGAGSGPVVTTGTDSRSYTRTDSNSTVVSDGTVTQTVAIYTNGSNCTQGTITTLHDGVVQSDLTVDDSNPASCTANAPTLVSSVTGRIDQLATAQQAVDMFSRTVEFNGITAIAGTASFGNGLSGDVSGYTVGGIKQLDNGLQLGAGYAQVSIDLTSADTAGAAVDLFQLSLGKTTENGIITGTLQYSDIDYGYIRHIGPYINGATIAGSLSSIGMLYTGTDRAINPVLGFTRTDSRTSAHTEAGSGLTARTVAATHDVNEYATIGAVATAGVFELSAVYHSDDVSVVKIGVVKDTENIKLQLGLSETRTNNGVANAINASINIKF